MSNKFVAKLKSWSQLSFDELRDLFSWSPDSHAIPADRQSLVIACAKDPSGQNAFFATGEKVLLVEQFICGPQLKTGAERMACGDAASAVLMNEAQKLGAERMLVVIPADNPPAPGEYFLRVVDAKVSKPATTSQVRFDGVRAHKSLQN